MDMPSDPRAPDLRRRRFRQIPIRMLVPNVITLLAICAGLTAIRLSIEGRNELALAAIVCFSLWLDSPKLRKLFTPSIPPQQLDRDRERQPSG